MKEKSFVRMREMQRALENAYKDRCCTELVSMRELARMANIPNSTLTAAMQSPADMRLSTLFRLWGALGYTVTIWCQGPGRKAFIFEE